VSEPNTIVLREGARGAPTWLVVVLTSLLGAGLVGGTVALFVTRSAPPSAVAVRPTNDVVVAVRDLARLETTEVRVEKVVDLADRQSAFFGLVDVEDAMLLVAAGSATVGVDLGKLGPDDVRFDEASRRAELRLPEPEVLSSTLDHDATYVYTRKTDVLAKRNEHLEARARKEAIAAIERAARSPETKARAKAQAERQLRALLTQLGAREVEIRWP
jgi:hypothetical protein